ncbi:M23 family metallopeptidase [Roseicyclus mahoneyensis]|uniref:Peptidase M23-like protein n=1 Tax=Roseicyclus mahoneyensis TaxID=164332 RepID=A0A316GEW5_9RHOB|nr:M23 family metallopeptidase [Roseicyclus mahoneyensis]PWK59486.1 peptidase M23-like protein [Roseicyclus mahoneyensis]
MRHSLATALIALALPAMAQDAPRLLFPVDCTLGETCFLQQFVDRDPGPGARDYACGPQSYDTHTGTDIRTADLAAMLAGVTVIAAADGVVRALRDGVPDGGTATRPEGQDCGNGVVLTHPGGWETQYCHLMQGSIAVVEGQQVAAGTPLGLIGYSGRTEFPHLEFILRHEGRVVDPFDPSDLANCGGSATPLWAEPLDHPGGGILSAGFAASIPEFEAIQAGAAAIGAVPAGGEALVLWAYIHSGRAGDTLRLRIADASGAEVHAHDVALDRTQAQLFRATGLRTPSGGWSPGLYRGAVTLIRDGVEIDRLDAAVIVTP